MARFTASQESSKSEHVTENTVWEHTKTVNYSKPLSSVNLDLHQNQIKLVVRMIPNVFLYKNIRFIQIF